MEMIRKTETIIVMARKKKMDPLQAVEGVEKQQGKQLIVERRILHFVWHSAEDW